jgi:hypothetical protein
VPLAGICAGGDEQSSSLPRDNSYGEERFQRSATAWAAPTSDAELMRGQDPSIKQRSGIPPDYILTGEMAVFGDRLSVTPLLLDSSTGRVLWGEKFDRKTQPVLIAAAEPSTTKAVWSP